VIEKFITFKEPHVIEGTDGDGIIFRTHVRMTRGEYLMISEVKRKDYVGAASFVCDEKACILNWEKTFGRENMTTEDIISYLNNSQQV
jgi:hypothetical protein